MGNALHSCQSLVAGDECGDNDEIAPRVKQSPLFNSKGTSTEELQDMVIKLDIENEKLTSLLAAQNEHPDVTSKKIKHIYEAYAMGRRPSCHLPTTADLRCTRLLPPSLMTG